VNGKHLTVTFSCYCSPSLHLHSDFPGLRECACPDVFGGCSSSSWAALFAIELPRIHFPSLASVLYALSVSAEQPYELDSVSCAGYMYTVLFFNGVEVAYTAHASSLCTISLPSNANQMSTPGDACMLALELTRYHEQHLSSRFSSFSIFA
jgi:hypothetical protein